MSFQFLYHVIIFIYLFNLFFVFIPLPIRFDSSTKPEKRTTIAIAKRQNKPYIGKWMPPLFVSVFFSLILCEPICEEKKNTQIKRIIIGEALDANKN